MISLDDLELDQAQWDDLYRNGVRGQGCDILDSSNSFVEDGTPWMLSGGSVTHDNMAGRDRTAGKCSLRFRADLEWGTVRVRPWVSLASGRLTVKIPQGVYVLTSPTRIEGSEPPVREVNGYDLTSLLTDRFDDTYVIAPGGTYLDAVRDVVAAANVGLEVSLAGDSGNKMIGTEKVWVLTSRGPTPLDVANDLLDEIAYTPLHSGPNGVLRSGPAMDSADRNASVTFDERGGGEGLLRSGSQIDRDVWNAPNAWRVIRNGTAGLPTLGNGMYEPPVNQSDGPASIDRIGRKRWRIEWVDAADQDALESLGDQMRSDDMLMATTIRVGAFWPRVWHGDVAEYYSGSGERFRLPIASSQTNLDGSFANWVLGGVPVQRVERRDETVRGEVTRGSAGGLRVVVDGASTDSNATSIDNALYSLGHRVRVIVNAPELPIVQGRET